MATYFVSPTGLDTNPGTSSGSPWQTITKVNATAFLPGDSILFQGGQSFSGNVVITGLAASSASPITIDSYGGGVATIAAGNGSGVFFHNCSGVVCNNLTVTGGVLGTNTGCGIKVVNDQAGNTTLPYFRINNITASGFGTALSDGGVIIYGANGNSG